MFYVKLLTLWMVDKCGDPEVGNFGDQVRPLLKERLAEFVVFLFYFEDLLTGLLVQPSEKKNWFRDTQKRTSVIVYEKNRHFIFFYKIKA